MIIVKPSSAVPRDLSGVGDLHDPLGSIAITFSLRLGGHLWFLPGAVRRGTAWHSMALGPAWPLRDLLLDMDAATKIVGSLGGESHVRRT